MPRTGNRADAGRAAGRDERRQARDLLGFAPDTVLLADREPRDDSADLIDSARAAVTRRRAGHTAPGIKKMAAQPGNQLGPAQTPLSFWTLLASGAQLLRKDSTGDYA